MDTLEKGTSDAENLSGNSAPDSTNENANGDTSKDGTQEDADTLRKRLADKDAYIKKLESERKTKSKSEPEDDDDVNTWLIMNTDDLKLCAKEYKEELAFYKSHKIPITEEIRNRALQSAKDRKGVRPVVQANRTETTSNTTGTEFRRTTKTDEIPSSVIEAADKAGTTITPERFAKYKAEIEGEKK